MVMQQSGHANVATLLNVYAHAPEAEKLREQFKSPFEE